MKKIMLVFGTRPEAIKMAPLVKAIEKDERFEAVTVVTAQHREMLDQVLDIFGFPPIGGEEGARRVQTLNMVNADIIDKYQLGSTGQTTEPDPPPDDPPKDPEPTEPKTGKEGQ